MKARLKITSLADGEVLFDNDVDVQPLQNGRVEYRMPAAFAIKAGDYAIEFEEPITLIDRGTGNG